VRKDEIRQKQRNEYSNDFEFKEKRKTTEKHIMKQLN